MVVVILFIDSLLNINLAGVIATLFILAMAALTLGLAFFLREIYLATRYLRIAEPEPEQSPPAGPVARAAGPNSAMRSINPGSSALIPTLKAGFKCVDALDDDGAVQAVAAAVLGQGAGHHHRAGRDAAIAGTAGLAVVDRGALADEHAHRDHRALFHHHALDDLRAGADEAVVLDDGGRGLQRFQHPADAHAAG